MAKTYDLELVETLEGHKDRVWCVAWSADGERLASCSGDKSARVWGQAPTADGEGTHRRWECEGVLEGGHSRTVRCVAWSPNGALIASCSFDATTCLWDKRDGEWELAATLEGHENEVKSVAWSPSGLLLATCSRDKSVWIWEVQDEADAECVSVLHDHTQDVKCVRFHPHEEVLASCSYDDTIKLYSEAEDDWECFDTLRGHGSTVWAISFDADGHRLASVSDDKSVKIWRAFHPNNTYGVPTGAIHPKYVCVCTVSGLHTRPIYSVSWSKKNGMIATAGGDDQIFILQEDEENTKVLEASFHVAGRMTGAHAQDVNCVAWNPVHSDLLASCSDDGTIKIWRCKPAA